jgi:hypothetical protein
VAEWDGTSTWSFVDGDGVNGINKDTTKYAEYSQLTVFNSKLYAIWRESNGTIDQIRVAEWDGNQTWNFVDGNGTTGINKDTSQTAYTPPQLTLFNSKLFAIWMEVGSTMPQIRVAEAVLE